MSPIKADNIFYVYELINSLDNTAFYVGKGSKRRMYNHIENAHRGYADKNPKRMIKILEIEAAGGKVLPQKLIENLSEKDAFDIEELVIRRYGLENLTNLSYGGEGGSSHSLETRLKMSRSHKGKKIPPEVIEKRRQKMLGHIVSEETRERIRQAKVGHSHTQETKRKISDFYKIHKISRSEEFKQNVSKTQKGHPTSEETIEKIRLGNLNKKRSLETRTKIHLAKLGNKNRLGHYHTAESRKKMSESHKRSWKIKRDKNPEEY